MFEDVARIIISSIRCVMLLVFVFILIAVTPFHFLIWLACRLMTLALPDEVYQAVCDTHQALFYRLLFFYAESVVGVKFYLSGDHDEITKRKESVICICNHQTNADLIVSLLVSELQGSLGHGRYVMKDTLRFIPLIGFYLFQHGCIFVNRNFFNLNKMSMGLNYVKNTKVTTWLLISPEGKRFSPENKEFIEKSHALARQQGLMPLKHFFTPKFKGTFITFKHLKENCLAIYSGIMVYSGTKGKNGSLRLPAPSMFEFLTGKCSEVYVYAERIPISQIPSDETNFKTWLHQQFMKKDKLLDSYYTSCSSSLPFSGPRSVQTSRVRNVASTLVFVAMATIALLTPTGRAIWWMTWLLATPASYLWMATRSDS